MGNSHERKFALFALKKKKSKFMNLLVSIREILIKSQQTIKIRI